ncbi:MAG: ABC transporter substrate-binding protein [Candidatus Poribacteria bacterium]|jgi:1,4-dihydroxy-6-naphthoate synthase|nr:ABC transporter substrate-binding protein [Candidatus Poribacteria bacterium]MDP6997082.1 ABC transporter substrate-binding protein [Candidatus Poribacteria bacterium]
MSQTETIRIGHSPDSDDAFMFYALAKNLIPTDGIEVVHVIEDIESLNQRALKAELEVTAVSIHAYAYIADTYALMPCGSSMGDRYGPLVVANGPLDMLDLKGRKIAIPGKMTSAYLTCSLFQPDFEAVVIPFDQIIDYVKSGEAEAGLIIHEGQLTYAESGLHKVVDLGEWWYHETGLPLPLGGNVIRRDLGIEKMKKVTRLVQQSIRYSLDNRPPALDYAMIYARDMETEIADQFVGMYVNDYTLDYGESGRAGVRELLRRGYEAGIITQSVDIEFVQI